MSIQFANVDLSQVKLAPPRGNKNAPGFKSCYIQYKGGQRLNIQTPVMNLPWDIRAKQMDENSNVSANLSLSFKGITNDEDCELNKFAKFMKAFDDRVKQLVTETKGGLGKKAEAKVLDANFRETLKESASGEYPPTIQPKIYLKCREGGSSKCVDDHKMDLAVYDMERNMIDCENLEKGCMAAAIITPQSVWASSMGVGITFVAKQVIVKPMPKESFAFSLGEQYDVLKSDEPVAKRARTTSYEEEEEEETSLPDQHQYQEENDEF